MIRKRHKITTLFSCFSFLIFLTSTMAQVPDHWETVIFNDDIWYYKEGNEEPPSNWMQPDFDDSQWATAIGGFGYGDGDDNTQISNVLSCYLRKEFILVDTAVIDFAILHADYDDAFVAYLNGIEIARGNIEMVGTPPAFNSPPFTDHEASLYRGGVPESFLLSADELKSLIEQGNNTLAVHVLNVGLGSSDFSSNFFLSLGIEDGSMNYEDTPDWFTSPFFETSLPLIIINTPSNGAILDEPRITADMGIIDNGLGQLNSIFDDYNDYNGKISIEIRGSSSQSFPKKNYGFETQLEDGTNNNVSLLGMPEENDWILHGPYSDKSLLRNVLAYHLSALTGRYAPRTRLCELIINDDYRGIYMLTEKIKRDSNRVDIATLKPEDIAGDELTGGYIIQIDRDDQDIPNDGWQSSFPDFKFYAHHYPAYDKIMPKQRTYISSYFNDFETMMNSPGYAMNYLDYVDIDSWVDYFLITEIGKHIDAFKLSFFMYKKKDSNGGKIHFGPIWDFNLAFGNFDFVCSPNPAGWSYLFRGTCDMWHTFWVKKLTEIPNVSHQTNCRWAELRGGPLCTDSLIQFIDDKVALIGDARERNFDRWPVLGEYVWPNDYVGDTYMEELDFLKSWLTQRLTWMDENMIGDCSLLLGVEEKEQFKKQFEIFPNPAGNRIYVKNIGESFKWTRLELFDLLGKRVGVYNKINQEEEIRLVYLTSGIYIYQIWNGDYIVGKGKLVKAEEGE